MSGGGKLRIGTRASALARWQAEWVAARLTENGQEVELVPISTQGDRDQRGPIETIGTMGVFTKELQRALLDGSIDVAVHSLKDLPTDEAPGLTLASVPQRGPTSDVLIANGDVRFDALPQGAVIGTGSLRRRAQLLHARSDLRMADIRGNVDTRLRKLREGEYDALVLAEAGVTRLGLLEHVTQVLPRELMLSAVGQGALGIEARADDQATLDAIAPLDDRATHAAVLAERALLRALRGGCLAPVAALAEMVGDELRLEAVVLSADGTDRIAATETGPPDKAESLGESVAQSLVELGATELIATARRGGT